MEIALERGVRRYGAGKWDSQISESN